MKKYQIGISLSGGGARGIAHIGVLHALEEAGIVPEIISGCSAGALIGAFYAAGITPLKILSFIENKSLFSVIKMGLPNKGLAEIAYFKEILTKNLPEDSFESLKKPLFISVTNLNKGGGEIIHSGKLIDFVIASSSIPLIFKPVKIGEYWYADGGVINNLPVEPIKEKCNFLIGVTVNPINYKEKFNGMADIGLRILDLSLSVNVEHRLKLCNYIIEPDTEPHGLLSVNKGKEIFDKGYEATLKIIPDLKHKIASIL